MSPCHFLVFGNPLSLHLAAFCKKPSYRGLISQIVHFSHITICLRVQSRLMRRFRCHQFPFIFCSPPYETYMFPSSWAKADLIPLVNHHVCVLGRKQRKTQITKVLYHSKLWLFIEKWNPFCRVLSSLQGPLPVRINLAVGLKATSSCQGVCFQPDILLP